MNFGGSSSKEVPVNYGVPQGSVLGPLLFLVFVNDLTNLQIGGSFTIFADDTTMLWSDVNSLDMLSTLNRDLLRVKEWFDSNKLTLNISKTSVISFKGGIDELVVDGKRVKTETCTRFLGLYIDNKLNFANHVEFLCGKLASGCHALRVIASNLDLTVSKSVYHSLIESHLRYAICFWGTCPQYLFNMVFVLQKRAIRCLFGLKRRDSCRDYFKSHCLLTLPSLFILETVCLIQKLYKTEIVPESMHGTRREYYIPLPIPSTSVIKNSLIYNGKKMFNLLPVFIRLISCGKTFRREVRGLLVARAYYDTKEFLCDTFV